MKDKKIIYKPDLKIFVIDGVKYQTKTTKYKKIDGVEHQHEIIFEEVDEKKQKEKIDFVKTKLAKEIPPERVIEEVLKGMSSKEVNKIYKLLKEKKAKVKRHDGCFGLVIDGGKRNSAYIEIFD